MVVHKQHQLEFSHSLIYTPVSPIYENLCYLSSTFNVYVNICRDTNATAADAATTNTIITFVCKQQITSRFSSFFVLNLFSTEFIILSMRTRALAHLSLFTLALIQINKKAIKKEKKNAEFCVFVCLRHSS